MVPGRAGRSAPAGEDKHKFVLVAIQRTLFRPVACPDAEIEQRRAGLLSPGKQLGHMAPVDADIEKSAALAEGGLMAQGPGEETSKFARTERSRSHRRGAVARGRIAAKRRTERGGEDHPWPIISHQRP